MKKLKICQQIIAIDILLICVIMLVICFAGLFDKHLVVKILTLILIIIFISFALAFLIINKGDK